MSAGSLHLLVVSPERVVLETTADRLALPGALGQLGILPGHARLITSLRSGVLEIHAGGANRKVAILGGFAEVGGDVVTVLADGAALPEAIDPAAAQVEVAAAEEALKTASGKESKVLRARLDAAQARLDVCR